MMKSQTKKNLPPKKLSRRAFIRSVSAAAASVTLLSSCQKTGSGNQDNNDPGNQEPQVVAPRAGVANPYVTAGGRPILVCVRGTNFSRMLTVGLTAIGGLSLLLDNNQDLLIKPNLVEATEYPWISDMNSITDIIRAAQGVTSGTVSVGDMSYRSLSSVYTHLNFDSVISNAGAQPMQFSATLPVKRVDWPASKPSYFVYTDIYNSPVIINTCLLKRHSLSSLTCAIKNNVGSIKGSDMSHSRAYMHNESDNFFTELADVASLTNPDLNIVDARSIVTVNGPLQEQAGIVVETNKIVICGDIVATDSYCARLMAENDNGFQESDIQETLDRAQQIGLGTKDLNQVEIIEIDT